MAGLIVLTGIVLIFLITLGRHSPATALPTNTSQPASPTVPTKTTTPKKAAGTPTFTPVDLSGLVSGTPLPVWKEIPLMPGAIAGNENDKKDAYLYSILATQAEVMTFYTRELAKLGWEPKTGNGTPAPGGILTLIFYKGQEACIVGIIPQKDGLLVMLGRQPR